MCILSFNPYVSEVDRTLCRWIDIYAESHVYSHTPNRCQRTKRASHTNRAPPWWAFLDNRPLGNLHLRFCIVCTWCQWDKRGAKCKANSKTLGCQALVAQDKLYICGFVKVVIQQWAVCGLPNDNLSVENGIIIATARPDAAYWQLLSLELDSCKPLTMIPPCCNGLTDWQPTFATPQAFFWNCAVGCVCVQWLCSILLECGTDHE